MSLPTDKLAALALAIAGIAALHAWWLSRSGVVRMAPGDSVAIAGLVDLEDRERLVFRPPSGVSFSLEGLQSDTWLGRPQWRGTLTASEAARSGQMLVSAAGQDYPAVEIVLRPAPLVESWAAAGCSALLGLGLGSIGWWRARQRAIALAAQGRAEILYRSVSEGGALLGFSDLQVEIGQILWVEGPSGERLGAAVVTERSPGGALARLEGQLPAQELTVRVVSPAEAETDRSARRGTRLPPSG